MPDLENPQTFGEWYWRNSVDAIRARDTQYEIALAPVVGDILADYANIESMPASMKRLLNSMQAPTQPEWATSIVKFVGELGASIGQRILGHELKSFDYAVNASLATMRITDAVANTLFMRKQITEDFWKQRCNDAGYSIEEMRFNYDAIKPFPTMPDIIAYARYHGQPDNPKEEAWKLVDISEKDFPVWEWLSRLKLSTEQVLTLYRQDFWRQDVADEELARLGWELDDRQALHNLAYTLPNAMLLTQGGLVQGLSDNDIIKNISKADIHPTYAEMYLDAILTKPATDDVINFELRRDPSLSNLPNELRKIGVHPNYHNMYRELAYPIPPIADIITMAVREAFTPDIAARFGQYEGLPQEYVQWVQRKGLSKEWAERYWAAHWSLPSPQQGFEMLHRGVISRDELSLLLRALDIMPFWRDKLMSISYHTLTRVDIRRMYQLGVLTIAEVKSSYRDLGYDETNAERMTRFTVKLIEAQKERAAEQAAQEKTAKRPTWTTAQTLTFLKRGLITPDRAGAELAQIGYDTEHVTVYLASVKPST